MSRPSKLLLLIFLAVFVLACNIVAQPVEDVQNLAGTAESIASAMPDIATTAEAALTSMPDVVTTLESAATSIPFDDFDFTDPQGTPLSEWKGVPVMTNAVTGQEFNEFTYSFKVPSTPPEVQAFYMTELTDLGWTSSVDLPVGDDGGFMLYTKESSLLAITITTVGGSSSVVLTLE